VQLEAVPIDVADRLEGKLAEHGVTVTLRSAESLDISSDSTRRRGSAQQCMQRRRYAAATTAVNWSTKCCRSIGPVAT
jgi:hypothetical protein